MVSKESSIKNSNDKHKEEHIKGNDKKNLKRKIFKGLHEQFGMLGVTVATLILSERLKNEEKTDIIAKEYNKLIKDLREEDPEFDKYLTRKGLDNKREQDFYRHLDKLREYCQDGLYYSYGPRGAIRYKVVDPIALIRCLAKIKEDELQKKTATYRAVVSSITNVYEKLQAGLLKPFVEFSDGVSLLNDVKATLNSAEKYVYIFGHKGVKTSEELIDILRKCITKGVQCKILVRDLDESKKNLFKEAEIEVKRRKVLNDPDFSFRFLIIDDCGYLFQRLEDDIVWGLKTTNASTGVLEMLKWVFEFLWKSDQYTEYI